jgi:hypothetical protein
MEEDEDWPATPIIDWGLPEKEESDEKAIVDPVCSVERIGAAVYHLSDSKPTIADSSGDQGDDEQEEEEEEEEEDEEDEEEQDQDEEDEEYEYDEAGLCVLLTRCICCCECFDSSSHREKQQ